MVNEKFVAFGTMVKILATFKSPCAKACYLIQNLKPSIERVYLPQLSEYIKAFKKISVPYATKFFLLRFGRQIFKTFISLASQNMIEE